MPTNGSPAIGAGNAALALDAELSTPLTSDQRGVDYPRVINGRVDLGAVQSNSGAASAVAISLPTSLVAGLPQNLTVSALTPSGNLAATYAHTIHFTSSDADAQVPADYTFTSVDAGNHTFSITLETAGSQSVTVTDTATSALNASQTVTVGFGAGFAVTSVSGSGQSAIVGAAFATTLTARVKGRVRQYCFGRNRGVFTAPTSGASGTFAGSGNSVSAQTNGNGVATTPTFTANNTTGQYAVTASVQGVQSSRRLLFTLTNFW